MNINKKAVIVIILIIVAIALIAINYTNGASNTGIYSDGKDTITVVYRIKLDTAELNAPSLGYDFVELKRAMSGSGARYLSDDGRIEFWEHQSEGKLSLDGKDIFTGKIQE